MLDEASATKARKIIEENGGLLKASAKLGLAPATLKRVAQGKSVRQETLAKISPMTRKADDFPKRQTIVVSPRRARRGAGCWSIAKIREARDAQLIGRFALPVALAVAMRADDAIFTAYHNRLAPQSAIGTELLAAPGVRGEAIAKAAATHCMVSRATLAGITGTFSDHGVAVGRITRGLVSDETPIVTFTLREWPLEFVWWDEQRQTLMTRVQDGLPVPITHGDGDWLVFSKFEDLPWQKEACVIPGGMIWASHADGIVDWNATTRTHGQAKMIGELPQSVPLLADDGTSLSADAEAFLDLLQEVASGESGAGIRPAGAVTEFIASGSSAWQIFKELTQSREKAAARVYLGTDATLGSVGGAPGVDIATLFGVASTKVQGDFDCLERALNTGFYAPWTAINYGESRLAPRLRYRMPDPDAEKESLDQDAKSARLFKAIADRRDAGMIVDQDTINALAARHGVREVPQLASIAQSKVSIALAPTDIAKVVRVREARAAQGLPAFGDARDDMTISELEAYTTAKAQAPA